MIWKVLDGFRSRINFGQKTRVCMKLMVEEVFHRDENEHRLLCK